MAPENPYRLPRTVLPERYELTVAPDTVNNSFAGEVRIHANATETVSEILLHAADLEISSTKVVDGNGTEIATQALQDVDSQLKLTLDSPISAGDCTIHIEFSGTLSSRLSGLYRSTFRDDDGNEHVIAATQFEPTDARRAFPCFDEPDMKAVFEVTLVVAEDLLAVSNTSAISETSLGNGKKEVKFAPSMRMSTYLVAMIVGPLVATEQRDVDGIPVRVICRPGREHMTSFALECADAALKWFGNYFGIPYPGDKLDLVGLPDFNMGAMENLGCVTFRETALLADNEQASRVELERVADVVAHELAHMWFGDLVTMKWWNGIWLNEAFATFMELLFVDSYKPEWMRWTTFGITRAYAFSTDGLASTRTIEFPVVHPSDAEAMFDVAITYQKGGAVVRMLEKYLEPGEFQRGIAHYLRTNEYGNTETTDLWDSIEIATGEPVRALMDTWIFQEGHPMISVSRNQDGTQLTFRQNRFLYGGARGSDTRWHVPIRIRASVNGEVEHSKFLLTDESTTITFPAKVDWVVVNDGSWGFFRTRYDGELLRALVSDITRLSSLERFTLVNDTWASVISGNLPVSEFTEMARLFREEQDPDVWATLIGPLDSLWRAANTEDKKLVSGFVRDLCAPRFAALGWELRDGESQRTNTARSVLISALGTIGGDEEVQRVCREHLENEWSGQRSVSVDLLQSVLVVNAWTGDEAMFEKYCECAQNAKNAQEEMRYLRSIARFQRRELIQQVIAYSLSEKLRPQDGMFVLANSMANATQGEAAWEMIKQHWDEIVARFDVSTIGRSVEGARDQYVLGMAADVRSFNQSHSLPGADRIIAQTIEYLEINEAFTGRLGTSLREALQ